MQRHRWEIVIDMKGSGCVNWKEQASNRQINVLILLSSFPFYADWATSTQYYSISMLHSLVT